MSILSDNLLVKSYCENFGVFDLITRLNDEDPCLRKRNWYHPQQGKVWLLIRAIKILMYIKHNRGPNINPCGTPQTMGSRDEIGFLNCTK